MADRLLAIGSPLTVDTLSSGQHTITASVTDSQGDADIATVDVFVSGAGGSVLLSDTFGDGDYAGWSIVDNGTTGGPAAWDVTAGELRQTSNSYGGYLYSWYLPIRGTYARWDAGLTWTDYQLDVTLRGSDDDGMGVMFRVQDNNNYYRFEMDRQRGFRRLVKKVNGSFTLLYSDSVAYAMNQDYQVTVTAQGSTLSVAVDGQVIFTGTDTSHSQGTVALYNYGQQNAYYDDVVVTGLVGSAAAPPLVLDPTLLAWSWPNDGPPWWGSPSEPLQALPPWRLPLSQAPVQTSATGGE